jgi:hypothetical protein
MTRFHWKLTRRDGLLLECELKFRLRDLLVSEKLGILILCLSLSLNPAVVFRDSNER